jgi:8-oxo-dGTP pyrophosphatase MutT (NUDIX family)
MLDPEVESEIAELAARYGAPRRVAVELEGRPFSPLILDDRHGEVCMVVRRPNGKLITATKTFYPPGAFRLLTGGVSHGEPIMAALLREVAEETGLDVVVRRFLAVIEYRLALLHPQPFATFAFLLDETGGTLAAQDEGERLGEFREVALAELPSMAAALERVPDSFDREIEGSWGDWGRFRAVVHRVVYEAMQDSSSPMDMKEH